MRRAARRRPALCIFPQAARFPLTRFSTNCTFQATSPTRKSWENRQHIGYWKKRRVQSPGDRRIGKFQSRFPAQVRENRGNCVTCGSERLRAAGVLLTGKAKSVSGARAQCSLLLENARPVVTSFTGNSREKHLKTRRGAAGVLFCCAFADVLDGKLGNRAKSMFRVKACR